MPRYYLVLAVGVSVLVALAANCLWQRGRMHLAIACATVLLLGNLAGLAGDNRNYMFGEHLLVSPGDRQERDNPHGFRVAASCGNDVGMGWRGAAGREDGTPPGELEFSITPPASHPVLIQAKGWTVIGQSAPPPSLAQRVLQLLPGISLPAWLLKRIGSGHPGVTLYRAG